MRVRRSGVKSLPLRTHGSMDTLSPQVHGPHSRAASPLSFRLLCTILLATGVGERAHDVRAAALGGKIPSLRTHGSLDTLSPYVHGPGQSRPCPLSLLMQGSLGLRPCPVIWPVTSSRRLAPKRLPFCPPLLLLLQQPQHPQPSTNQHLYSSLFAQQEPQGRPSRFSSFSSHR